MVGDPGLHVGDLVAVGELNLEVRAELRLSARSLEEHDELASDREGESRPWSSSTRARHRSMPAVTPAEVATLPSRTKIGSGSTVTAGNIRARRSQLDQWVVARRPSSSPACASTKAPEHTEVTRRDSAGDPPDGRDRRRVEHQLADSFSPGDDERVHRAADVGDRGVDHDAQAARGPDGSGGRPDHLEGVAGAGAAAARGPEHLDRAGDVEGLGAVVGEDHDSAGQGDLLMDPSCGSRPVSAMPYPPLFLPSETTSGCAKRGHYDREHHKQRGLRSESEVEGEVDVGAEAAFLGVGDLEPEGLVEGDGLEPASRSSRGSPGSRRTLGPDRRARQGSPARSPGGAAHAPPPSARSRWSSAGCPVPDHFIPVDPGHEGDAVGVARARCRRGQG